MFSSVRVPIMALALMLFFGWLSVPQDTLDRLAQSDIQSLADLMPAAGSETADVGITPHKALYRFGMIAMQSGAGVSDIRGQMYYEQADACDAYTSEHRFSTEYHYPERPPIANTSNYVAWEAKDGSLFHFSSERQENGVPTEELRGAVERAEDGTAKAEYTRPEDLSFDLPQGYLLPTAHTIELVARAKRGENFFSSILFDGTDAEGPIEVNAFIGKAATAAEIAAIAAQDAKKIDARLLPPAAWHVRMAVFPLADAQGAEPSYEMDLLLHDNGVVSHARVDYGTFKVEQKLAALEALPVKGCP